MADIRLRHQGNPKMTNVNHLILGGKGPISQHVMTTYDSVSTHICLHFGH